ncbi:hypothetical protein GCM10022243_16860 [Saccharothrix violaceirubra]
MHPGSPTRAAPTATLASSGVTRPQASGPVLFLRVPIFTLPVDWVPLGAALVADGLAVPDEVGFPLADGLPEAVVDGADVAPPAATGLPTTLAAHPDNPRARAKASTTGVRRICMTCSTSLHG